MMSRQTSYLRISGIVLAAALIGFVPDMGQAAPAAGTANGTSETTLLTQDFESATVPGLPTNWASDSNVFLYWQTSTSASLPVAVTPHGGSQMVQFGGDTSRGDWLWNWSGINCMKYTNLKLRLWVHHDTTAGTGAIYPGISWYAPGATAQWSATGIQRLAEVTEWTFHEVDLPDDADFSPHIYVGFYSLAAANTRVCMDDVTLVGTYTEPCAPNAGTAGTQFTIRGRGFGTKPGKLAFEDQKASVKVSDWTDTSITCAISSAPPPALYDLTILTADKEADPIVIPEAFNVQAPSITGVDPAGGAAGAPVTVTGTYFTAKKGKISLIVSGSKGLAYKACKVASWTMDTATGASQAEILMPKGVPSGTYDLVLQVKGMPDAIAKDAITIP